MQCAARNTNQIAGANLYGHHFTILAVNMEKAVARNDEPDFVFVVPVFAIESCQHFLQSRRVWTYVHNVCRYVTAGSFQLLNLIRISFEYVFRRGVGSHTFTCRPTLVVDPQFHQTIANLLLII